MTSVGSVTRALPFSPVQENITADASNADPKKSSDRIEEELIEKGHLTIPLYRLATSYLSDFDLFDGNMDDPTVKLIENRLMEEIWNTHATFENAFHELVYLLSNIANPSPHKVGAGFLSSLKFLFFERVGGCQIILATTYKRSEGSFFTFQLEIKNTLMLTLRLLPPQGVEGIQIAIVPLINFDVEQVSLFNNWLHTLKPVECLDIIKLAVIPKMLSLDADIAGITPSKLLRELFSWQHLMQKPSLPNPIQNIVSHGITPSQEMRGSHLKLFVGGVLVMYAPLPNHLNRKNIAQDLQIFLSESCSLNHSRSRLRFNWQEGISPEYNLLIKLIDILIDQSFKSNAKFFEHWHYSLGIIEKDQINPFFPSLQQYFITKIKEAFDNNPSYIAVDSMTYRQFEPIFKHLRPHALNLVRLPQCIYNSTKITIENFLHEAYSNWMEALPASPQKALINSAFNKKMIEGFCILFLPRDISSFNPCSDKLSETLIVPLALLDNHDCKPQDYQVIALEIVDRIDSSDAHCAFSALKKGFIESYIDIYKTNSKALIDVSYSRHPLKQSQTETVLKKLLGLFNYFLSSCNYNSQPELTIELKTVVDEYPLREDLNTLGISYELKNLEEYITYVIRNLLKNTIENTLVQAVYNFSNSTDLLPRYSFNYEAFITQASYKKRKQILIGVIKELLKIFCPERHASHKKDAKTILLQIQACKPTERQPYPLLLFLEEENSFRYISQSNIEAILQIFNDTINEDVYFFRNFLKDPQEAECALVKTIFLKIKNEDCTPSPLSLIYTLYLILAGKWRKKLFSKFL